MTLNEYIKKLKLALNAQGEKLDPENPNYLGTTTKVAEKYDIEVLVKKKTDLPKGSQPWMNEAKADLGKKETDASYNKEMSAKWKLVGLNLGTIKENWAAWCGLFVAACLAGAGYGYQKNGATAKNWDNFGQKIEWKINGIPQGAIVRINHNANCKSSSSNHVTFSYGDCTPEDVKSGNFQGLGGNQGNMVKVSSFPMGHICSVRWPNETDIPAKVTMSKNCKASAASGESTR